MFKKVFIIVLIGHLLAAVIFFAFSGSDETTTSAETESPAATPLPPQDAGPLLPFVEDASQPPSVPPSIEVPYEAPALTLDDSADTSDLPATIDAKDLETAIVVDASNGKVIWDRKSDQAVPIASMTKMMTALLVLEEMDVNPDLTLETIIRVTKAAYSIGGSQVWLDPRESFSLRELLISIMVKSANDSSYLVGEYISNGDMAAFIRKMNERAEELGMEHTQFLNAHGLPEKEGSNKASCQDLAKLAYALIQFENATKWASIQRYTFRPDADKPTVLDNHNRLIFTTPGVDGLKTGYTRRAGFCVTATCLRDGKRIIVVATGFSSSRKRDAFVKDLIDWSYTQL